MANQDQDRIPSFFSVFFLWFDPLIAIWGVYLNFITPAVTLNAAVPHDLLPYDPLLRVLFQQLGAFLLGSAWFQILLQRYTRDLGVWKIVQSSVLIVDTLMLYSIWDSLGVQGRRSLDAMRAEDWGSIAILGGVAIIRLAFLAENGFPKSHGAHKNA